MEVLRSGGKEWVECGLYASPGLEGLEWGHYAELCRDHGDNGALYSTPPWCTLLHFTMVHTTPLHHGERHTTQ